ncbi:cobalamin-binding protein [Trinickia dabaoshanensis]|uniref:Cobalamin-binding protein n=1 Tax=Trinickia dabaoshanensis TaxID=564714 RepID=A0A2N7VCE5_9BURK|nr:cobalamin-binding protein [Trinickia dabaoshanensis]PMS14819.1 cobalamin-binding protein [Trinickia dabaoshanensis]
MSAGARIVRRAAALGCACALALLGARPAAASVSVTDDAGERVTLAAPAERIVALAPHAVELVYAAGGGAKLVGAVSYSDYPSAAKALPRVGTNTTLDLERIVALKPDLVIVWRHGNSQRQLDRLRALGIPLYRSEPHKLDDVATDLIALGTLMGTGDAAQAAAAQYRGQIAALRARYAQQPPVSVFYEVWADPLMTLSGAQIISDVIALCGGRNVFANLAPLVPTVSTEAVVAADPEAIVTSSSGATKTDAPLPSLAAWRAWPGMTAVARGNLFAIDGDLITRPGPRLAQGANALCRDLDLARTRRPSAGTAPDRSR